MYNKSPTNNSVITLPEVRQKLASMFRLEYDLYDFVKRRLKRQCEAFGIRNEIVL